MHRKKHFRKLTAPNLQPQLSQRSLCQCSFLGVDCSQNQENIEKDLNTDGTVIKYLSAKKNTLKKTCEKVKTSIKNKLSEKGLKKMKSIHLIASPYRGEKVMSDLISTNASGNMRLWKSEVHQAVGSPKTPQIKLKQNQWKPSEINPIYQPPIQLEQCLSPKQPIARKIVFTDESPRQQALIDSILGTNRNSFQKPSPSTRLEINDPMSPANVKRSIFPRTIKSEYDQNDQDDLSSMKYSIVMRNTPNKLLTRLVQRESNRKSDEN